MFEPFFGQRDPLSYGSIGWTLAHSFGSLINGPEVEQMCTCALKYMNDRGMCTCLLKYINDN